MNKKIVLLLILFVCANKVFCQQIFSGKVLNNSDLTIDSTITKKEETVYVFGRNTTLVNADAAVSILNKNTFEKYNPSSFVAAFNTVPGVRMDERSPGSYRINIRGNLLRSTFGVRNVKVYLNGLPFTDASGNTYFNTISPSFINSIQIIRGPGGSMYGAGTGGVILMKTDNAAQNTNVQMSGGSYGMFNASVQKNTVSKNVSSNTTLSHQQADGYRDHSAMRRDAAAFSISYKGIKNNNITGTAFYSNLVYNTPGGLTMAQLKANPKQARPASAIFKGAAAQKAALYLSNIYTSLSDEITISNKWKNTTGVYFSYTDFKNPTVRNYERKYEKGMGGRTSFEFTQNKWTIITGAEYQYSFINTATHGNKLGVKDTLQYYDKIKVNQVNIFSQAGYQLPLNILLTAGISYNNFTYHFFRVSPAEEPASSNFSPQYIPRFSLQKKFKAGSVYASFSKGYSPPTIDEIHASNGVFNTALNAERSNNYEAGVKINLFNNLLYADVAYYVLQLNNTLVGRRDAIAGDFFINAGSTKQHGVEFSFTGYPVNNTSGFINNVKLQMAGAATDAKFKDYQQGNIKYSGNKLTGTSPFIVSLLADVVTIKKIYSNITYNYTDKMPLNDANTIYAKAYNLLFIKVGRQHTVSKKIKADSFISWMKSFNKNYSLGNDLNADGNRFFNPAAMQTITAGVSFNFIKE
ncbi:MAG: TonB-dependent receptor plug domain-containing protein [Ferruginibacter sp.]|nr:TonB-dependent receptor plug domain-containing protein [Ferruginibacter sp.]